MKKIILKILICTIAFILLGCKGNPALSVYDDEAKISSETNSYNLDEAEQNIDSHNFVGNIGKFEGMDTIWYYESDKDTQIDMKYKIKVTSGKVKLVLISPDATTTTLVEITDSSDLTDYAVNNLTIKKGENKIKMVAGKNTNLEFDISIEEGEFGELGF